MIDSNVLIAASTGGHSHHIASEAYLERAKVLSDTIVSLDSLSEFYNIATRPMSRGGSEMTPMMATSALRRLGGWLDVRYLTIDQQVDAIHRFAALGGIGARLYDYLIGRVAELNGAETIVTWNQSHLKSLFPHLKILTPAEALA